MENVKTVDNFFPNEYINEIKKHFNLIQWNSSIIGSNSIMFLKKRDIPFWKIDLTNETLFSNDLKNIICSYFKKEFNTIRIYAVSQFFGQESNFHYDDKIENRFTVILYLNDDYSENDDGYFYIKIPNKKHIINIEPFTNRLVLFPSDYFHKGSCFNRISNELRICITWKLEEYK
jgi:hypothetical protein